MIKILNESVICLVETTSLNDTERKINPIHVKNMV